MKQKNWKGKMAPVDLVGYDDSDDILVIKSNFDRRIMQIKKGEIYFLDLKDICGPKFDYSRNLGMNVDFEFYQCFSEHKFHDMPIVIKYCGNNEFEEMTTGDKILYVSDSKFGFYPSRIDENNKKDILDKLRSLKTNLTQYELFLHWSALFIYNISKYNKEKYFSASKEQREKAYFELKQIVAELRKQTIDEINFYIENFEPIVADKSYDMAEFENQLYTFADVDKQKYIQ